jgi:hypothetical protein
MALNINMLFLTVIILVPETEVLTSPFETHERKAVARGQSPIGLGPAQARKIREGRHRHGQAHGVL